MHGDPPLHTTSPFPPSHPATTWSPGSEKPAHQQHEGTTTDTPPERLQETLSQSPTTYSCEATLPCLWLAGGSPPRLPPTQLPPPTSANSRCSDWRGSLSPTSPRFSAATSFSHRYAPDSAAAREIELLNDQEEVARDEALFEAYRIFAQMNHTWTHTAEQPAEDSLSIPNPPSRTGRVSRPTASPDARGNGPASRTPSLHLRRPSEPPSLLGNAPPSDHFYDITPTNTAAAAMRLLSLAFPLLEAHPILLDSSLCAACPFTTFAPDHTAALFRRMLDWTGRLEAATTTQCLAPCFTFTGPTTCITLHLTGHPPLGIASELDTHIQTIEDIATRHFNPPAALRVLHREQMLPSSSMLHEHDIQQNSC